MTAGSTALRYGLGAEAIGTAVTLTIIGVVALLFVVLIAVQLGRLRRIRKTVHW